ncbi:MAG: Helicase associated domain protein [Nitrospirota bacterium]|nr:Helicase associated domain protein [Nitrospirota bacterium]
MTASCRCSLRLGSWVRRRRYEFRRGRLDPDRVQRFEALPGWVWDARER